MKYYLHRKNILALLIMFTITAAIGYMMRDEHYKIVDVLSFVACLALVITIVRRMWVNRKNKTIEESKYRQTILVITDNELLFPNGYYFRQSQVNKDKKIAADRINELNFDTFPLSVVIDDKEVIFLKGDVNDQLTEFAHKNNIIISKRTDVWGWINEPFLDTEFDTEQKQRTIDLLAKNGISPEETIAIRKKISFIMYFYNCYVWEWQYLGQFDYLAFSSKTKKKYWWSMEIALRNYHRSIAISSPNN